MLRGRMNRGLLILTVIVAVMFGITLSGELMDDTDQSPAISFGAESLTVSVEDDEDVLLEDVTAEDLEDGDVTESVVIESISEFEDDGSRTVTYVAFDSGDNVTKADRSIYYSDYESPKIILLTELTVTVGSQINLQNCIRVDDVLDGNITSLLQITESDYSQYYAGDYKIALQVTNSAGDTSEAIFTIHCVEESSSSSMGIELTAYSAYVEKGDSFDPEDYIKSVSGTDIRGNALTADDVSITDSVNTDQEGQYTVIYEVETSDGSDSVELVVIVR